MTERFVSSLGLGLALAIAAGCGGSTGLGKETRADITARMESAQPSLETCYQTALKSNRKLQGLIELSIVAAPQTGQFQDVTVVRDELNDPAVRACVIAEVGKLKLEKPPASRVSINYPIRFSSN
jgi:hypothetical protein